MKLKITNEQGNRINTNIKYFYQENENGGYKRLVVSTNESAVDLIIDIASTFQGELGILYILVVPRMGEQGRYQSPSLYSIEEIKEFLNKYNDYLEQDGRHHLWIASPKSREMIVYDRHDIMYVYSDNYKIKEQLESKGFVYEETIIPSPHDHYYHEEFDSIEIDLFNHFDWIKSPLHENDN